MPVIFLVVGKKAAFMDEYGAMPDEEAKQSRERLMHFAQRHDEYEPRDELITNTDGATPEEDIHNEATQPQVDEATQPQATQLQEDESLEKQREREEEKERALELEGNVNEFIDACDWDNLKKYMKCSGTCPKCSLLLESVNQRTKMRRAFEPYINTCAECTKSSEEAEFMIDGISVICPHGEMEGSLDRARDKSCPKCQDDCRIAQDHVANIRKYCVHKGGPSLFTPKPDLPPEQMNFWTKMWNPQW